MFSRTLLTSALVTILLTLSSCDSFSTRPLIIEPTPHTPTNQPTPYASTIAQATATSIPGPTNTPAPELIAQVAHGGNVRATPINGNVVDLVEVGETVKMSQKNADASWYLITTARNITGWVSVTLITIDPAIDAQIPNPSAASTADTASTATQRDWKSYSIGQNRILLPPTWRSIALTKADLERAANELANSDPAQAQSIQQMITSGGFSQITFFAIDSHQNANINLIDVPRPADTPLSTLLQQMLDQFPKLLPKYTIINSDRQHQANGLPAGRVVYNFTLQLADHTALEMRGVQWYIADPSKIYVLTITGLRNDDLVDTADRIAQSFGKPSTSNTSHGTTTYSYVTHGGNLRNAPQISASNVIGQVCPGDQIMLLERTGSAGWSAIRIIKTSPDCDPNRVAVGTEGWVSNSLLGAQP